MDVRSQISMVFHLDKCIGCHTCSVACKNIWTDRKGTEYMWWNNVETKPGTGYPTRWEDQDTYHGGWEVHPDPTLGSPRRSLKVPDGGRSLKVPDGGRSLKVPDDPWKYPTGYGGRGKGEGKLRLRANGKAKIITNIFHNPALPSMDDYYEPWTYDYSELIHAPEGPDQPTARPISMVTGEYVNVEAGPNWDDDLSGSPVYAANDVNLEVLSVEEKEQLFAVERLVFFYFPRICNHCLNPACVASCPSGALYKRGEDGIVLIDQTRCRGWRACVSACPYKKTYFNWQTGKSEKCILCFPRIETGQAPACFHSCVGRIRYLGVLLYDASRIEEVAVTADKDIVEAHRSIILDPFDPEVIAAAKLNGIHDTTIEAAQASPVYKFVKVWKLALPPHLEYRTLPMLFYVPPMGPVMASKQSGNLRNMSKALFSEIDDARLPIAYLAKLLGAGNQGLVRYALRKQLAVRTYRRALTVGDVEPETARRMLLEADLNADQAEAIYKLTSLCTFEDRFVIPPAHREEAIEMMQETMEHKQEAGFGLLAAPRRGL